MVASSGGPRRQDTDDPRHARSRALRILFQADVRNTSAPELLDGLEVDASARAMLDELDDLQDAEEAEPAGQRQAGSRSGDAAPPIDGFTQALVRGVAEHREEIDQLITRYARRWQIHRMPVVDRTVLRLATYELLHESTPPAVAIDEAVELAKSLSTDDSGRYVNGVLESIRKDVAARGSQRPSA